MAFKDEKKRFFSEIFKNQGEIGNKRFFFYLLIYAAVESIILLLFMVLNFFVQINYWILMPIFALIMGFFFVISLFQVFKRLRSIGKKPVAALTLLIPFYNVYLTVLLFFKK